ncbi:MAG: DUF882 domain-containing protein [Rhodospirillales bacterium]|nr:DUF882 domain-containing protein [Alphaproteobacteria bacterium]MCB9986108.1 DUF882 domain-containing protein [Rhodospirillales bacterium]USO07331.1 MAG: DUF882 domain-containing protein [Rhodospirillales bacterium]
MKNFLTRRSILKTGLAGFAGLAASLAGILPAAARETIGYSISIKNVHTGETFNGVYRVGGYYVPRAFRQINHVMRDHYDGTLHPIDPRLVDVLARLQKRCACNQPLTILSGYRSPTTNAMLRRESPNVAKNSFHMKGQAADIRVPGSTTSEVRQVALSLRAGGVGYYPRHEFVHVDTGDVRTWVA